MTSQLESLIQQATQLNQDEKIKLINHVADSLHSINGRTSEIALTDIQQIQLERLRSEIKVSLEQIKTGDAVDGETVLAGLRTRTDSFSRKDAFGIWKGQVWIADDSNNHQLISEDKMQYQVFVKSSSDRGFTASVLEIPSIAVNGNTEDEAIANAKTELESQLATGKIVTISLAESFTMSINPREILMSMPYAGVLENDPTFDDMMEKLDQIRQAANQVEDEI